MANLFLSVDEWRIVLFSFVILLSLYLGLRAFPEKNPLHLFMGGIATLFLGIETWSMTGNMPLAVVWFGVGLFIFLDGIAAAIESTRG